MSKIESIEVYCNEGVMTSFYIGQEVTQGDQTYDVVKIKDMTVEIVDTCFIPIYEVHVFNDGKETLYKRIENASVEVTYKL